MENKVSKFILYMPQSYCQLHAYSVCNHPCSYIFIVVQLILQLPFFYYAFSLIRRLKFQLRNRFMPGICYVLTYAVHNLSSWIYSFVLCYFYREKDKNFCFRLSRVWDDFTMLADVMFMKQIAIVLICFNIKIGKYLKYFNYFLYVLMIFRIVCKFFFTLYSKVDPYTIPFINEVVYNKTYIVYSTIYNTIYIIMLILMNICFVLSSIKDYIPKKYHLRINIALFMEILGSVGLEIAQRVRYSVLVMKYEFIDIVKFNYIRVFIHLYVMYCMNLPYLIIIWTLSSTEYVEDQEATDVLFKEIAALD